jgi:hypothetical protein
LIYCGISGFLLFWGNAKKQKCSSFVQGNGNFILFFFFFFLKINKNYS